MKKLIFTVITITVFLSEMAVGQTATATVEDVVAAPGTQKIVPVNVTGFNDIYGLTMYFEYDPDVVTFVTFQNPALDGMGASGTYYAFDGKWRVGLSWSSLDPESVNGKLVDIVFYYSGGESDFIWSEEYCQIVLDDYLFLPVIYIDGSIGPVGEATVTIPDSPAAVPGNLTVPINVDLFNVSGGVGSFTFKILYDETKLTFLSISNISVEFPGINIYTLSSPTRLVLDYVNATQSSNLVGKLLDMNFTYSGGSTTLDFNEDECVMANDEVTEISVIYTDGQITQDPASLTTVSLQDQTADPGTPVTFPLSVTNFNDIVSFDLRIVYDPAVISFVELDNFLSPFLESEFMANETDGELSISFNTDGGPKDLLSGNIFDIIFNYNTGSSTMVFDLDNCEVANDDLEAQVVVYDDGSISEALAYDATATIGNELATTGQPVNVPVWVTGFTNLGAINFDIEYNTAVLGFVEILNVHPVLAANGSFSSNATAGHLYFEWQAGWNVTGVNIPDNDKLFDMNFSFSGGSSDLTFNTVNCEVSQADELLTPLLVSYFNGSVIGGIVSLTESTITANPVEVELNEPSVITVQLKDQLGNNLPGSGGTVQLFTTLGTLTAVTDNNDGTYTATLTSASSGIATITGTLDGDAFTDDATVKVSFLLTLEIAGNGKVKIGDTEYTQPSQVISVTTPTVLLESIPVGFWRIYSWKEGAVVQTPLGASTYTLTMDADKTVLATFHLPGDATCDGTWNVLDIESVINHIFLASIIPCYDNADVDRNNSVNINDLELIVNIVFP